MCDLISIGKHKAFLGVIVCYTGFSTFGNPFSPLLITCRCVDLLNVYMYDVSYCSCNTNTYMTCCMYTL